MPLFKLVWKELAYRWVRSLIVIVILATVLGLFTFIQTTSKSSIRSMQLIMKDLGQNIILMHRDTDLDAYYTASGTLPVFPELDVPKIASNEAVSANYYLAVLTHRVDLPSGKTVILTGKKTYPGIKQRPGAANPYKAVATGMVRVGYTAAGKLNAKAGKPVEILGRPFKVSRVDGLAGTIEDDKVHMHLADLQGLLDRAGLINSVEALECQCGPGGIDEVKRVMEKSLAPIVENLKVIPVRNMALARYRARKATDDYFFLLLKVTVILMTLFLSVLGFLEVRERERELAILRAIGIRTFSLILVFLSKPFLLAVPGAVLGFLLGAWFSLNWGSGVIRAKIYLDPEILFTGVEIAVVVTLVSGMIPLFYALGKKPANAFRDQ